MYLHSLWVVGVVESSLDCSPSVTDMEVIRSWKSSEQKGKRGQISSLNPFGVLPSLIVDYMHRQSDLPLKEHAA